MPTIIKLIGRCKNLPTLKPIHILSLIVFFIILTVCTSVSIGQQFDYTQEEIAKLDNYAKIIGQAWACNVDISDERAQIWNWLKKKMDMGYPDRLSNFIDDSAAHHYHQVDVTALSCNSLREISPPNIDCPKLTCAEVRRVFYTTKFDLP